MSISHCVVWVCYCASVCLFYLIYFFFIILTFWFHISSTLLREFVVLGVGCFLYNLHSVPSSSVVTVSSRIFVIARQLPCVYSPVWYRCCMKIMPFADRRDRNKSKFTDRIRGKSTDEILEEIKKEFGNNRANSMFFDESDSKRTSPQRVCMSLKDHS